ncbi:MAG: 8-amino-7-oxononanoate synthase [Methylomonas sp.]|nr:8-amino-7-oxononanoate synthase [Methylomonas sp.]PPD20809.1 MAG: 8-amino-7-oxononanoate synthase [Methylomonas sp.]PPD27267.1 MAG: 8-amino-7-oxononanoate synthase [Methylomonas sp.]PPD38265.1 MAG: 8-amino-7-oxononanoate synthase [Methylomonas sp.]PPD39239.1 MAG: 8-amino-7-oxononanoate synthase [Methylomonas sp.]
MSNAFYAFDAELERLTQHNLYRRRRQIDGPQQGVLNLDGRPVVNFCSNDYLGLANHPAVVQAFKQGCEHYGVGSGSAHLICGHSTAHHALEQELAAFTGRERALLFSTGYMANLGVVSALAGRGDCVLQDRLNHASLIDAAVLSRAKLARYRHGDSQDLSARLAQTGQRTLIVSDGVFSMDGDLAPLPEMAVLARRFQAGLMIDDAHGFGVLGQHGGGIVEHFGLNQDSVPILVGTLGKAFGTFGAFVAGSAALIEYLIQKARSYVYTTALPPAVAEATRTSLALLRREHWRRDKLQALIAQFQDGARHYGLPLMASPTPIQPIVVGDRDRAVTISQRLLAAGFWVSAIRPPTVPAATARLRITLSAAHQPRQVDALLTALAAAMT